MATARPPGNSDKPSVLILDDEKLISQNNKQLLTEHGYTVTGLASDGISALMQAEIAPPDLALIDVRLGGDIDGITVAKELRRIYGTRIIFVTGEPSQVLWAFQDMTDISVLSKPFDNEKLLDLVANPPVASA